MKIVRVLEDLEGGSLGFHWTNREIPMFDAFLPKSKFYIRVENKPLERFTTRQVRLSQVLGSTFLKEAFHSGTSVIVSDCPKGQDTPDGDLHIWPELCDTGLEILLSNETFGFLVSRIPFEECHPEMIRLLASLLHENKTLTHKISLLQLKKQELRQTLNRIEKQGAADLFPDRKAFREWVIQNMDQIEPETQLLERNYPKIGMDGNRKAHIDFLFTDLHSRYLLVEVLFYKEGFREELTSYINRLQQAARQVVKDMAAPASKIRVMVISNSLEGGLEDLCAINQIELIYISGYYTIERVNT